MTDGPPLRCGILQKESVAMGFQSMLVPEEQADEIRRILDILQFERIAPIQTQKRLHHYIERNYTPGGRRIVYSRGKRVVQPTDRRRKLRLGKEIEIYKAEGSVRIIAKRFGVSPSLVWKIKHDPCYGKSVRTTPPSQTI